MFCEFRDYFCGEQDLPFLLQNFVVCFATKSALRGWRKEDLGLADDVFPLTRRDTWRETWVERQGVS